MFLKKIKAKMVVLTVSILISNTVHAHSGSPGHVHGLFEDLSSGLGIVAIIAAAAIVVKLVFNSKIKNTQGDKA